MLKVTVHEEEQQRLLPTAGESGHVGSSQSKWARRIAPIITAVIFVIALGVSATKSKSNNPHIPVPPSTLDVAKLSGANSFIIKVSNEYGDVKSRRTASGAQDYPFLSGAFLIEPHKSNNVEIVTGTDLINSEVQWALSHDTSSIEYNGIMVASEPNATTLAFTVIPVKCGRYTLTLTTPDGHQQLETVYVKYVRRELDLLTDEDREIFLDAMYVLWNVSTVEGQKLYGENYKSAYYFTQVHIDAVMVGGCDQFHEGIGFLSNHVYLTNYFEQSLQLVDPRTALHYVEYTRYFSSDAWQSHLGNTVDGGSWLFYTTAKWFGSNDPITGRILDGRWADTKIPRVSSSFYVSEGIPENETFWPQNEAQFRDLSGHLHGYNAYGLQRNTDSMVSDQHILRFNNADRLGDVRAWAHEFGYPFEGVTCGALSSFFEAVKNGVSRMDGSSTIEWRTHADLHSAHGGAGGGEQYAAADEKLKSRFGITDYTLPYISMRTHVWMKSNGVLQFSAGELADRPKTWNCTTFPSQKYGIEYISKSNMDLEEEFGVIECDAPSVTYESEEAMDFWLDKHFTNVPGLMPYEFSKDDKAELIKTIANRHQHDGDMHTSASPTDPLFWIQHCSTERLWQFLEMQGLFTDQPFDQVNEDCAGHSADGLLGWLKGYMLNEPTIKMETVPVSQLVDLLNPLKPEYADLFNFIYEPTQFDWCPGLVDIVQA